MEGHALGRLDGFIFTPDASSAGSDAKALAGAAQKALAGEIDARALRLAQAADGQFVLLKRRYDQVGWSAGCQAGVGRGSAQAAPAHHQR